MMKKIPSLHHPIKTLALAFLILLGSASTSKAQTEELTLYFSAYDSATLLNVPIDSVIIKNISQQDTMVLFGPNPEVTLQWTGISEPVAETFQIFNLEAAYPNPFHNTSTVSLHVFDKKTLHLKLLGLHGEALAELQDEFNPGRHLFRLSTGQHNLCVLSVSDGKVSSAVKLINLSPTQNSIDYLGQDGNLKSETYMTDFDFSPGDTLHFSVFAGEYFEFNSEDAPYESTGYTFELLPLPDPPAVSVTEIANITATSAICYGEVTNGGGAAVTARGICWSTSPNPTIDDDTTHCGLGTGTFHGQLNNLTENTEYYVRTWATNSERIGYSEETLSFVSSIAYTELYVPGDYQGWDPSVAPVIYDFDGDGVYNGYIFFPEGGTLEFRFTSAPSWDYTVYGYGGEGLLNTDPGANNLSVPQTGGYKLEVDINNLTWSYDLQNWAVIGEWLGWEEDIDMVWNIETQELSVTVENIPPAENQRFKFRANDAWETNLGSVYPPDGETLVQDGSDIPIPDGGTITFILRFTTPMPTYELIFR